MSRARYRGGSVFRHKGCKKWEIQYYVDGRRVLVSTGLESKEAAQAELTKRLNAVNEGEPVSRERQKARVAALYLALEEHVKVHRPKSLKDLRGRWSI